MHNDITLCSCTVCYYCICSRNQYMRPLVLLCSPLIEYNSPSLETHGGGLIPPSFNSLVEALYRARPSSFALAMHAWEEGSSKGHFRLTNQIQLSRFWVVIISVGARGVGQGNAESTSSHANVSYASNDHASSSLEYKTHIWKN